MTCCQCEGIEKFFGAKEANRRLRRYRNKGPLKTTRILLEVIKAHGVEGMRLLDIGGGVGAIQHELLSAGLARATDVDASSAYIEAAKEEAQRREQADRIHFRYGNFVDLSSEIETVDIVTLDRVICCYHDMGALVKLSSARARRLYGLVFPRDNWFVKIGAMFGNFILWISRNPFRTFVHPTEAVDSVVRSNGLERRFHRKTALWQVAVYERK